MRTCVDHSHTHTHARTHTPHCQSQSESHIYAHNHAHTHIHTQAQLCRMDQTLPSQPACTATARQGVSAGCLWCCQLVLLPRYSGRADLSSPFPPVLNYTTILHQSFYIYVKLHHNFTLHIYFTNCDPYPLSRCLLSFTFIMAAQYPTFAYHIREIKSDCKSNTTHLIFILGGWRWSLQEFARYSCR